VQKQVVLDPFLCIASSLPIAWKAEKYFGHQPQFRLQSIGITSSLTAPSLFIGQVLFQEYLFNEMWNRPAQAPVAWMTPQHLVAPIESPTMPSTSVPGGKAPSRVFGLWIDTKMRRLWFQFLLDEGCGCVSVTLLRIPSREKLSNVNS
jgi:hypothetical protein